MTECDEALTSLHLYTRTIRNPSSDPLTTRRGLSIVGRYAFDKDDVPLGTSRIAARCLNNIIVLAEPMRQVFVDEQYPQKVIERLKVSVVPNLLQLLYVKPSSKRIPNRRATLRTNLRAPTSSYSPPRRRRWTSGRRLKMAGLQSSSIM